LQPVATSPPPIDRPREPSGRRTRQVEGKRSLSRAVGRLPAQSQHRQQRGNGNCMTKPPRIPLMERIAQATLHAYDADRRANPERFTNAPDGLGPDFLFVENVARMLACSVDHVRRIPRQALPASKVGNRLIYQRVDVEAYIRAQRDGGTRRYVASRKLQPVANTSAAQSDQDADLDPVAFVGRLLESLKP